MIESLGSAGGGDGGGLAGEIAVGAFRGTTADFAGTTLETNANIPLAGALPIGISGDVAVWPTATPADVTLWGSHDAANVADDFQSVGVGVQIGGGMMINTVATGTVGFSGVNGEGIPFVADTPQTRSSGAPNGEAQRQPDRYEGREQ